MAVPVEHCGWCGREVTANPVGRRRRYCQQSCRQRAYEQRASLRDTVLPAGSVVLTAAEAGGIADRAFAARCAAEDVATAVADGASAGELARLAADLVRLTRAAERLR